MQMMAMPDLLIICPVGFVILMVVRGLWYGRNEIGANLAILVSPYRVVEWLFCLKNVLAKPK